MYRGFAVVAVSVVAGAAVGGLASGVASPQPAEAGSDAALLRRIETQLKVANKQLVVIGARLESVDAGIGQSPTGTIGLWGEIRRLRLDQAQFCRSIAQPSYVCPAGQ